MKLAILWAVTVAYFVQAVVLAITGDREALIIFGYALANCGLIWSMS
jgi:hypothetical protein